jgi:hypothetical protein
MLTVGLTCTQLSRPFSSWVCHVSDARGGCNVYPRFAFLFISPSCYFPAKFNVSISFAVAFCNLEPRRPFLSIGYRHRLRLRSCQCLYGFAIVLPILHQIPVVVRSPDLWLLFGFSVSSLSRLRLRYLFCSLIICSGATWFYLRITVIPISAFLSSLSISGVLAAQPALSFLASVFLPSFYSPPSYPFTSIDFRLPLFVAASTVLQSLWPPHGRLWRFGFLFCSSVSFLSRAPAPPSSLSITSSYVVFHRSAFSFLRGLSFPITAFSSVPSPLIVLWIYVIAYLV